MTTYVKQLHAKFGNTPSSEPEENACGVESVVDFGVFYWKLTFLKASLPFKDEVIDRK